MADGFDAIIGQPRAVEVLRGAVPHPTHAYLFLGPRGAGKRAAAAAFAGEVLAHGAGLEAAERTRDLARREQHPDIFIHVPEGAVLRIEEDVQVLIREAFRSPVESARKVVVCDRIETASDKAAGALLKVVEEPPGTAILILLTETVPPDHVALASRCVRVDFPAVSAPAIAAALVSEGLDPNAADGLARAAAGNVSRARLLATDPQFLARRNAWAAVPQQLDGTGSIAASLVEELELMIDDAAEPLAEKHRAELEEVAELEERMGTRGSGRKALEVRQKREMRLLRTDELRLGFATLASCYHEGLATAADAGTRIDAIKRVDEAAAALTLNPIEKLLLQALFLHLPPLPPAA